MYICVPWSLRRPKKRLRYKSGPVVFTALSTDQQRLLILKWLTGTDSTTIPSTRLTVKDLQEMPPLQLLDSSVDETIVQKLFTRGAWVKVVRLLTNLRATAAWTCSSCLEDLDSADSIGCECCLLWYHQKCVGVTSVPKKSWVCISCYC